MNCEEHLILSGDKLEVSINSKIKKLGDRARDNKLKKQFNKSGHKKYCFKKHDEELFQNE